jgi:hypothetical protein
MTEPGLISVIMPAYNAEQFIDLAVESVLGQRYQKWELLIVNDGSSDRTGQVVAKYADPRIRVFHQQNRGEAAARNAALEQMRGELVGFLDADDVYLPNHLEQLGVYLATHDELGGVYSDGYYIDESGKRLQTLSSRRRGPFEGHIFEEVVYGSDVFGPPACVVLRADLIAQHRLRFDENIIIGPDWDFFMRYAELARFGYLNEITCLYRIHTSNISLRTGLERRAAELAKCRLNATQLKGFAACSERTRFNVFFDLLVDLLCGQPDRQTEVTQSPAFRLFPKSVRAKLIRLMAATTLVEFGDSANVERWIKEARALDPLAWRGALTGLLYGLNPALLQKLLEKRGGGPRHHRRLQPFADMLLQSSESS